MSPGTFRPLCCEFSQGELKITQPHSPPAALEPREPAASGVERHDNAKPNEVNHRQPVTVPRRKLAGASKGNILEQETDLPVPGIGQPERNEMDHREEEKVTEPRRTTKGSDNEAERAGQAVEQSERE